jgi:hypothetical protein
MKGRETNEKGGEGKGRGGEGEGSKGREGEGEEKGRDWPAHLFEPSAAYERARGKIKLKKRGRARERPM